MNRISSYRGPFYFALNLNFGINSMFSSFSNTLSDRIVAEVIDSDRKGGNMKLIEGESIELKAVYTPELKKEVVAFANSSDRCI